VHCGVSNFFPLGLPTAPASPKLTEVSDGATPRVDVADLYARYAPFVLRRVLRFFARDEAEEVVHEVFVKVLENAASFRAEASPTTWLYRLTTNHCINRVRDLGRRRELWQQHGEAVWIRRAPEDEQETAVFLREFWQGLDAELVQVGLHYFVDGMTHAEIARVMNVSRRTVGNRLEQLREEARSKAGLEARGQAETEADAKA
jgi:RNA polymerase sigma-70 factor (ECF subfamily)